MLGPTGKFPHGKLNRKDKGEVVIAIKLDHKAKTVVLDFGIELDWIGFGPDEAEAFGEAMISAAQALRD